MHENIIKPTTRAPRQSEGPGRGVQKANNPKIQLEDKTPSLLTQRLGVENER